jgi:hypothetical protein
MKERIRQEVYDRMCINCPDAKKCHDECTECDEFTAVVEMKEVEKC